MPEATRFETWVSTVETMQGTFVMMALISAMIVGSWYLLPSWPVSAAWVRRIRVWFVLGGLVAWVATLAYSVGMGL